MKLWEIIQAEKQKIEVEDIDRREDTVQQHQYDMVTSISLEQELGVFDETDLLGDVRREFLTLLTLDIG